MNFHKNFIFSESMRMHINWNNLHFYEGTILQNIVHSLLQDKN